MIQPWYHYWYGLQARLSAIRHLLRGHDLVWRDKGLDEWRTMGIVIWRCSGDIVCRNCPDCQEPGSTLAIWCRGRYL